MGRSVGIVVILFGLATVVIGLGIWAGAFSWFGRLPGDIRIERESTRVYIPVTSMVIVSIVASVVLTLLGRWIRP
jgi:uncharacterized protein HemY